MILPEARHIGGFTRDGQVNDPRAAVYYSELDTLQFVANPDHFHTVAFSAKERPRGDVLNEFAALFNDMGSAAVRKAGNPTVFASKHLMYAMYIGSDPSETPLVKIGWETSAVSPETIRGLTATALQHNATVLVSSCSDEILGIVGS
jgi:hypothetical protein